MSSKKKLNVIWILGEAIRNYPGKDRFGKYKIIDEISSEGVYFENVVDTTASTLMSQSSLMTSQPGIHLSRTNADFSFDHDYFPSISRILKKNGYTVYATTHSAEVRKRLKQAVLSLDQKELPDGIRNDDNWKSQDINKLLDHLLERKLQEPFFLLLNYNNQENTAKYVRLLIERLKKEGLYDDCLFLFCPDHGWNDNERKKIMKRHDLILTNSNILQHLFLKYPSCPRKRIKTLVSPLDITPTILDIVNIPHSEFGFRGMSLLPLIEHDAPYTKKLFRSDIRYIFQKERATALQTEKYKYIFRFDEQSEEFYDLSRDPDEQTNLIASPEHAVELDFFRKELQQQEKDLVTYHTTYLTNKFQREIAKHFSIKKIQNIKRILLLGSANSTFISMVIKALDATFSHYELDVVINKKIMNNYKTTYGGFEPKGKITHYNVNVRESSFSKKWAFEHQDVGRSTDQVDIHFTTIHFDDFMKNCSQLCNKPYDLTMIPLDNPFGAGRRDLMKIASKLTSTTTTYLDYNLTFIKKPPGWFLKGLSLIYAKKTHYLKDPKKLLIETKSYLRQTLGKD